MSKLTKQRLQNEMLSLRNKMMEQRLYYILPEESRSTVPNFSHINNGYCGVFSSRLYEKFGDQIKVFENVDFDLQPEHWFVYHDGLYYDCECIQGVEHPSLLPIFKECS